MVEHLIECGTEDVFGLVGCCVADLFAEQCFEWLGEFSGDDVVVVDQEPAEEGLIELTAELVRGRAVGSFAVLNESEGPAEIGLGGVEVVVDGGELPFCRLDLRADSRLLSLEEVEWDGIGVVGFEELLPFVAQLGDPASLAASLLLRVTTQFHDLVEDVVPDLLGLGRSQPDCGVRGDDGILGLFNSDGLLGAGRSLLLTTDTDEVLVGGAMSVLGMADNQSASA